MWRFCYIICQSFSNRDIDLNLATAPWHSYGSGMMLDVQQLAVVREFIGKNVPLSVILLDGAPITAIIAVSAFMVVDVERSGTGFNRTKFCESVNQNKEVAVSFFDSI